MNRPLKITELLGIGLFIGVLGLIAFLSVRTARASLRDAVRLSDVRDVQLGLELYFNDTSEYPAVTEVTPLGTVSTSCLSRSGFRANCVPSQETVYTRIISATPSSGLHKVVSCGNVKNAYCFKSSSQSYGIEFELERTNTALGVAKGANCATPAGIKQGKCPAL
jgi:hypothetical protein